MAWEVAAEISSRRCCTAWSSGERCIASKAWFLMSQQNLPQAVVQVGGDAAAVILHPLEHLPRKGQLRGLLSFQAAPQQVNPQQTD